MEDFRVSYSKMGTYRRCKQKYQWTYMGDKPVDTAPSMGQLRGSAGHAFIAEWHNSYDENKAINKAREVFVKGGYEAVGNDWFQLFNALTKYAEWSKENDTFKILASEQKFNISFTLPSGQIIVLNGFMDGIIEDRSGIWVLENKFYKRVDTTGIEYDMQSSTYLLAAQHMGYNVQGVLYNIVRIGGNAQSDIVTRRAITRNKAGLARLQDEILIQAVEMIEYGKTGVPYRTMNKECHWDCPFFSACLSMNDDGLEPTDILKNLTQPRMNTYVAREATK